MTAPDPYQPGAIVSDSWGYDQTNIDFYRIIKRKGDWLTLQPLEAVEVSSGPETMTGTVTPGPDKNAKTVRRRLCFGTNGGDHPLRGEGIRRQASVSCL